MAAGEGQHEPSEAADWLERRTLDGPSLQLSPLRVVDDQDFIDALGDADTAREVTAHLSFGPPVDVSDARRIISELIGVADRVVYAQRLRATGELIGVTSFYEIVPELRALAIGHTWIARRHWRTGVNTESKLIMLRRAFDGLGAERVVWHTDIRNLRSQAAIERLGATREGVLRHHRIRPDGSWRDTVQYSMLSAEWPATKARLESASATRGSEAERVVVTRNDARSRYEGRLGDEVVGVVDFVRHGSTLLFTHTGTEPQWRGRGFAAQVTGRALDDVRARGERVRPLCPFTAHFIDTHPAYADLVG